MTNVERGSGVHHRVVERLGASIVQGDLAPGTVLPTDELERRFDASRTAIREAQKVLMAKGLLAAKQRTGTFVRPPEDWVMLDADVLRWRWSGPLDPKLLTDLDGMRRIIEPHAAALAAQFRTDEQLERIEAALERFADAQPAHSNRHIEADVAFHSAILDATGNEILSSLKLILEPALRMRDRFVLVAAGVEHDAYDTHAAVATAIADQDSVRAQAAMLDLIESARLDVDKALSTSDPTA